MRQNLNFLILLNKTASTISGTEDHQISIIHVVKQTRDNIVLMGKW